MTSRLHLLLAATCALALIQLASGQTGISDLSLKFSCVTKQWGDPNTNVPLGGGELARGVKYAVFRAPDVPDTCRITGLSVQVCDLQPNPTVVILKPWSTVAVVRRTIIFDTYGYVQFSARCEYAGELGVSPLDRSANLVNSQGPNAYPFLPPNAKVIAQLSISSNRPVPSVSQPNWQLGRLSATPLDLTNVWQDPNNIIVNDPYFGKPTHASVIATPDDQLNNWQEDELVASPIDQLSVWQEGRPIARPIRPLYPNRLIAKPLEDLNSWQQQDQLVASPFYPLPVWRPSRPIARPVPYPNYFPSRPIAKPVPYPNYFPSRVIARPVPLPNYPANPIAVPISPLVTGLQRDSPIATPIDQLNAWPQQSGLTATPIDQLNAWPQQSGLTATPSDQLIAWPQQSGLTATPSEQLIASHGHSVAIPVGLQIKAIPVSRRSNKSVRSKDNKN
ncbi:uncharacterized protein LOC142984997 [Anticarsia gemmatalis]|uniref:uncharacterized protein LOC142984997 n=1 Tax=Anticarsia gemmatalis TaxID=129554 RepID=UPI003F75D967